MPESPAPAMGNLILFAVALCVAAGLVLALVQLGILPGLAKLN